MGATFSVIKAIIIPAVIALLLFVVSTYVLFPLWNHYRGRYSHYLPLDSISTHTSSIRGRVQGAITGWAVPSRWRFMSMHNRVVIDADDHEDIGYSSEEGEELNEVDDERRRALSLDTRGDHTDNTRRLSRDLEEGFRDDSEDEEDDRTRAR